MAGERSFAKYGAKADKLQVAADERLSDAEALFAAGRYAASIMMGLYALEIQLKVVICRNLDIESLPKPFETHDLEGLLILSGQSRKLPSAKRPKDLAMNWEELLRISRRAEQIRYSSDPRWEHDAAERVLNQLRDPTSGVLPWLPWLKKRSS